MQAIVTHFPEICKLQGKIWRIAICAYKRYCKILVTNMLMNLNSIGSLPNSYLLAYKWNKGLETVSIHNFPLKKFEVKDRSIGI
jgi:hypothetical protein